MPLAMSHKPIVSVIIVSYNTRVYTVEAVRSALKSTGFKPGEIEVILVDNNSPDDTVAYLKKHLPKVKVIANRENRGFGGGNNQAAKIAKGQYLLLLNPDAFLDKDSLKVLVDVLEKRKDIVSVGLSYATQITDSSHLVAIYLLPCVSWLGCGG